MKERRSARRVPLQTLVSYNVTNDGQALSAENMAKSLDISAQGVHLTLNQELAQGDCLQLMMGVGESVIEMEGKTVWFRGEPPIYEVGLHVDHPPKAYTNYVENLPES
jgi:hypothetical protein